MSFVRFSGLAALALSLAACGTFSDPVDLRPVDAPRIAYDSVVTFTVGAIAGQPVVSTGGPIIAWSVSPALPAGLSLSAATGAITGLAAQADTGKRYVVTAKGPGGNGTASFTLRVLPETVDTSIARPQIALASPAHDTVGQAASHPVTSTGGPVTGYAVSPALPPGLALNIATGAITGTPTKAFGTDEYAVIAFGPGGRDTATLTLAVYARPGASTQNFALTLRFHGARSVGPVFRAPAKRAAATDILLPSVTLKRMILAFHSSAGDTLRDTVLAGSQGLPLKIDTARVFRKEYALPGLRSWSAKVRVLDARDSVIFADSGALTGSSTLDLFSRFVGFRSTYSFPDSIRSASTTKTWTLALKRFVLKVDSANVVDTSAPAPGFKQSLSIEYPYLLPGRTYALTHSFSGSVDNRADTVLFQASGAYTPARESASITLQYVGPTDLK